MNTKVSAPTRSGKYTTHKETYQAKLETLRRKEVRKHKRHAGGN